MSDTNSPQGQQDWRAAFVQRHELPASYREHAQLWFDPLVADIALHQSGAGRALLVGLNGCQGSGKTTLGAYLVEALAAQHGLRALAFSLDDFYLPRAERQRLAAEIHPLLVTRGVPGTHDMPLLQATLRDLGEPARFPLKLVGFDKSSDDRRAPEAWVEVEQAPEVIILEGWCLGARPVVAEALTQPLNDLERREDSTGEWRRYVNEALRDFLPVYKKIDYWAMLAAPDFDCVLKWRGQQEAALARRHPQSAGLMEATQLARFVQHFQRLTEQCLKDLPDSVTYLLRLDAERNIVARQGASGSTA